MPGVYVSERDLSLSQSHKIKVSNIVTSSPISPEALTDLEVEPYFATASILSLTMYDTLSSSSLYDPEPYFATASIVSLTIDIP
jgi:hypothetical protein